MPVAMAYMGLSEEEALEKIRTTDLRETCEYVQVLEIYIKISTYNHRLGGSPNLLYKPMR